MSKHTGAAAAAVLLVLSLLVAGCARVPDNAKEKIGRAVSDAGMQIETHINHGRLADLQGFWGQQASLLKEAMDGLYERGFSAERIVRGITGRDTGPSGAAGSGRTEGGDTGFGSAEAVDAIAEQISETARQAAADVVTDAADAAEEAVDRAVEDAKKSILERILEYIGGGD